MLQNVYSHKNPFTSTAMFDLGIANTKIK